MTIREYLKSLGATDQQLSARVVELMERAAVGNVDLMNCNAAELVEALTKAVNSLGYEKACLEADMQIAHQTGREIGKAIASAREQLDDLRQQTSAVKDAKINNPDTLDAVRAFTATLNATRDVFGSENLTPDVMIAAVNAGSYIAWRGIMGPKDTNWDGRARR